MVESYLIKKPAQPAGIENQELVVEKIKEPLSYIGDEQRFFSEDHRVTIPR